VSKQRRNLLASNEKAIEDVVEELRSLRKEQTDISTTFYTKMSGGRHSNCRLCRMNRLCHPPVLGN
jgi:hypothetical protein